jgi:outer membrane lipoprotein-sorting protein
VQFRQRFRSTNRRRLAALSAGLVVIILGIFLMWGRAAQNSLHPEDLAERMESWLQRVNTVQGELQLINGDVALEQELWVERPRRLRTEIEEGPPALAPIDENHKTTLVLTEEEAWFYNPNLGFATVADRTVVPEAGLEAGGSILESMPEDLVALLQTASEIQIIGEDMVAGRDVVRVQILLAGADNPFLARRLNVALDREFFYPLAIESDSGFLLRFRWIRFNEPIDPATFVFVPPPGIVVNRIGE